MSQTRHFAPEVLGPSLDTTGGEVQQPGVIRAGEPEGHMSLHRARVMPVDKVVQQGSDKFAVVTLVADNTRAWQLLPANQDRKGAVIYALGQPIYLGDETNVANAAGSLATAALQPPRVLPIPASVLTGTAALFAFEYTGKQGLYVCSAAATAAQVYCFVESYDTGTPVT